MTGEQCAICGEPVVGGARLEGFSAWVDDGVADREVTVVVHTECYMATAPAERDALLERERRDRDSA